MRHAIVSDIHANLPAWEAVLFDIKNLEIDHIVNLGDIVGYGPNPKEVLESVKKHTQLSVIGNHDAVCAGTIDSSIFNNRARSAIEWTRQQLSKEDRQFLKEIPEKVRPNGQDFLITHAEVVCPLNFGYILTEKDAEKNFAACKDPLIFTGHTHRPGAFVQDSLGAITILEPNTLTIEPGSRYIINPGSVGDPRCGEIAATYCIYDSEKRSIEFRQIPFDIDTYREAINTCSLTELPFFIRYLDSLQERVQTATVSTPKMEEYQPPEINLHPPLPKVETKKKHTALITACILMFLTGIGFGTFSFLKNRSKIPIQIPEGKNVVTNTNTQSNKNNISEILNEPEPSSIQNNKEPILPTIESKEWPMMARYVKISGPQGVPLVLAEVEVISEEANIARVKKVTQSSSRYKASYASRAIDGNRKGKNPNSLAYTTDQSPAWWEVDLGQEYRIDAVHVWNREASLKVMRRLNGFYLTLRDADGTIIYQKQQQVNKDRLIKVNLEQDPSDTS